jgi:hypothetical protein
MRAQLHDGRTRWIWFAAVASAVLVVIPAAPAPAQEALAASCAPQVGGNSAVVTGGHARAQTFTPSISGRLTSAQVVVARNSIGPVAPFELQIRALDPGTGEPDAVLASTTVPDDSVPQTMTAPILGVLATPVNVAAGQDYALLVTRSAEYSLERTSLGCPGTFWFASSGSGPWSSSAVLDMVFSVFVTPAQAEPEPEPQPGDSNPPGAQITKSPKDKTKKKTATFEFTGTDARAVASFQCKLDAGAFAACTSPHTVKVKKGKHTFQVQAIDQAGNIGSPATDNWKVKKKRKK